jgi:hypothetical protein
VAARGGRTPLASVPVLGRRGAIALTCAAALLVPAAAHANAFDEVLREYQKTGKVDGCEHTAKELEQAKAQMPKDIAQSAPGFPAQLAAAAAQRAKSACDEQAAKSTSTAAAAAPPATTTTAPAASQPPAAAPAPTTTQGAAPAPAPAGAKTAAAADDGAPMVLAVAGALVVLILVLWALAHWWAWEPRWLVRWRHATAEAGWRASAAWAEFTDWLRLGR